MRAPSLISVKYINIVLIFVIFEFLNVYEATALYSVLDEETDLYLTRTHRAWEHGENRGEI